MKMVNFRASLVAKAVVQVVPLQKTELMFWAKGHTSHICYKSTES